VLDPSVFVHSHALCETDDVGPGTRVWAFTHLLPGARVGANCNICDSVYIEGGAVVGDGVTVKNGVQIWDLVTVEDDVFLGPNMVFTNDLDPRASVKKSRDSLVPTRVERGATIGANATVVCGVTIGTFAFIGAGAVVTRNVPAHALVVGNPARRVGWACQCGQRLDESLSCSCGRRYRLVSDAQGLVAASSDEVSNA
jgi:UDP-2-acetamido-3-amino-2,3-dideoxy-glucuronate N-acetyltransferase